ncbi:nwd1 protein [Cenococcum geophilum]
MQTLEGHRGSVSSVAFSADSKLVVSGSVDRTIKIWDVATGREMRTLAIGTTLYNISFDITGAHLDTDIGVVVLDTLLALDTALSAPAQGYSLSSDGIWTTWDSKNLLWLPTEYRPGRSAVSASTVAIGCASGRVLIFKFPVEEAPVV